jgi:hypothetical protein
MRIYDPFVNRVGLFTIFDFPFNYPGKVKNNIHINIHAYKEVFCLLMTKNDNK